MHILDRETRLRLTGWLLHGAGLLALAAGGAAFHLVIAKAYRQRCDTNEAEAARLIKVLETSRETQQEHQRLKSELARLERNAATMRLRIPDQPQESEFLRQVAEAANDTQLHILHYERKSLVASTAYAQFDIRLSCRGGYESLCRFLDRLNHLPRATVIKKLDVNARDNLERYPVDMTLTLYCRFSATPGSG